MTRPPEVIDRTDTVLVVGAGPGGLAAVKNLRERGHRAEAVEKHSDIGGNWNIDNPQARIYGSTHFISSKPQTSYPDFPMPADYPDYPRHDLFLAYLRRYAEHFDLLPYVRLSTRLQIAQPVDPADPATEWRATLQLPDGSIETADYRALVVANGHNWDPKWPHYPGMDSFEGEMIHAADYAGPDQLRGKRVLVVGAGNTGCDLAVESAQYAARTLHSTRRGYWYAPKYALGRPADQVADLMNLLRIPVRVKQALLARTIRLLQGSNTAHGLPEPDHRPLEVHAIVNSLLMYYIGQGDITPVPDVERFDGHQVELTDGRRERVDLVVMCTGYWATFPFLDQRYLNWHDGRPWLYEHVFSPQFETLFVVGLLQGDGAAITPMHWQTMAVAEFLSVREREPAAARAWFQSAPARLRDSGKGEEGALRGRWPIEAYEGYQGGVHHDSSTRHYFEIANTPYLRAIERTLNDLEGIR